MGVVNDTGVIRRRRFRSFYLIDESFRRVRWIQEEVGVKIHIRHLCICHWVTVNFKQARKILLPSTFSLANRVFGLHKPPSLNYA